MIVLVALLALAACGCARTRAQTVPEAPPLAVPAPPPRVIPAPPPDPAEELAPPVEETPSSKARQTRKSSPQTSGSDPKKVEPPPTVEPPPVPQPATLQPGPVATQTGMESRTRLLLKAAASDLQNVNPNTLDRDAREQWATADRFRNRANEALAERNFIYAVTLAEKAATIAADLAKRVR